MQPEWWKYVVDVAQILSALGTCGAVIVALWATLRPPDLHISGSVGLRTIIGNRIDGSPEYVCISVTNNGDREFIINGLTWVPLPKSKLCGFQLGGDTDTNVRSDVVPRRLAFGESASFYLKASGSDSWFELLKENPEIWVRSYSRRESLQKLRLHVTTSIGRTHSIKPEKGFLDRIWPYIEDAIKENTAKAKSENKIDRPFEVQHGGQ